jgi:hypothetical protein
MMGRRRHHRHHHHHHHQPSSQAYNFVAKKSKELTA